MADMGPMPYDKLDYVPSHGSVAMRGCDREWNMEVTIEQGRAMEADGIPVFWILKKADWPGAQVSLPHAKHLRERASEHLKLLRGRHHKGGRFSAKKDPT